MAVVALRLEMEIEFIAAR